MSLQRDELARLVHRVFAPRPGESRMAVMVDLPDARRPDTPAWRWRRELAAGWVRALREAESELGLACHLLVYRNAGSNNAPLPETAWLLDPDTLPDAAEELPTEAAVPMNELLAAHPILMAPTELSATAPLKLAARELGIRAATMPGFSEAMIPALRLDYGEVNRRVNLMKDRLDRAQEAVLETTSPRGRHRLLLDLRHRTAHASGGVFTEPGTAGNLPSGEAYIVPYEGEREGDPSRTSGELPVQLEGETLVYRIEDNRIREVEGDGPIAAAEREAVTREPAYANVAELGLGVLAEFGIAPTGTVLLDEKLAPHVAFGRSDHFGGAVGPDDFSSPERAVHIDRVYLRALQPAVSVSRLVLRNPEGELVLMENDRWNRTLW